MSRQSRLTCRRTRFGHLADNGGCFRKYQLTVNGSRWSITDATERADITFSDNNRKQTVHGDWKPTDTRVPLCDRVAIRRD